MDESLTVTNDAASILEMYDLTSGGIEAGRGGARDHRVGDTLAAGAWLSINAHGAYNIGSAHCMLHHKNTPPIHCRGVE